jgi:hypothetical protein
MIYFQFSSTSALARNELNLFFFNGTPTTFVHFRMKNKKLHLQTSTSKFCLKNLIGKPN